MINNFRERLINRYYLHRYLTPFCNQQLRCRSYSSENTIALFAQPRSGSTWLAEVLRNSPQSLILNEPLWRGFLRTDGSLPGEADGRLKDTRDLNFYYYQPIPENESWPEATFFFDRLFRGGIPQLGLYTLNNLNQLKDKSTFIYKFCYGNLLFHWLLSHFDVKPVVLMRHPCAVIASQLKNIGYKHVIQNPTFQLPFFRYNEYFKPFLGVLKNIHSAEGLLAAIWAINTKAINEKHQHNKTWHTISYEKLYLNPVEEISLLFNWLNKPLPTSIDSAAISLPSVTTSAASKEVIKKQNPILQLNKWKSELSQKQINNIIHIVRDIGVDFYSANDPEPDYSKFPK